MDDVIWVALITIVGSLLTGLLVAWATFRVARTERSEQRRRDLDAASAEFLSAVIKAAAFLRQIPRIDERHPTVWLGKRLEAGKDKVSPGWTWVDNQRRLRRAFGEQPFLVAERVVDAAARLQALDPPPDLAAAVETCLDYVAELGIDRPPELLDKWPVIHERLLAAIVTSHSGTSG